MLSTFNASLDKALKSEIAVVEKSPPANSSNFFY
jgi:hypothetical protein